MARIQDVAAYILDRAGPMTAMKLQKLCYYGQAWHLVWDEEPLFTDRVEAWANGPVVPSLYQIHRGRFTLIPGDIDGDMAALTEGERSSLDAVLEYYGDKPAHWLSELTHREPPWRDARVGLDPGERGNTEITHDAMHEYYDGMVSQD